MVALNAQIFAAHVDAGASLEVVARNTRLIADESMHQLDEISSRVNELVDAVADLEQRLADYSEMADMERQLLASEAAESEKKLHSLDKTLRASMAGIGPIEAELGQTIETLIRSIHFPAAVAEAEKSSTSLFEQIVGLHSDRESIAHRKVQDLARNYTMAHEREVHETTVKTNGSLGAETTRLIIEAEIVTGEGAESKGRQPEESPALGSAYGADEDKLADNVELF
jgi:hypothetical protein